jgi:DNA-binding NarL/FixJ family response regulator
MKLGARGFLMKSADKEEFQLAVQKILAGGKYFSSELMEKILSNHSTESSNPGETQLTEREIEIVREVAAGLSSQEIADKLFISVRTVETHRKNIMSKLDVKNMAGLVRFALVNGLISN